MNDEGLITIRSKFSVGETIDRLAQVAESKGLKVFARIDHGAGAERAGFELRPTQLVIFGNPKGGTPLIQARQTAGIDLPLKVLAWKDGGGDVWLTYNDARWLARRHDIGESTETSVAGIESGLAALCGAAAGGAA